MTVVLVPDPLTSHRLEIRPLLLTLLGLTPLSAPCVQVMKDSAPELNVSSSETEEDKEEAKPDGEKDPDFNQVRIAGLHHCAFPP